MPAAGSAQVRGACTILSWDSTHIPGTSCGLGKGSESRLPCCSDARWQHPHPPMLQTHRPPLWQQHRAECCLGSGSLGGTDPPPIKCKGLSVLVLLQAPARRRSPRCVRGGICIALG